MSETPTMTETETGRVELTRYPGYALTPDGDLWNLAPSSRGRFAGSGPRLVALSIHPRGRQWTALLKSVEGKWERRPIRALLKETFGENHESPRFQLGSNKMD